MNRTAWISLLAIVVIMALAWLTTHHTREHEAVSARQTSDAPKPTTFPPIPASTDLPETHEESFPTPPKPPETSSPGEHSSFAGQVLSTGGDPIAGAEVNFVRQGKAFSTVSDGDGLFFFDAPAAGATHS